MDHSMHGRHVHAVYRYLHSWSSAPMGSGVHGLVKHGRYEWWL
jgi:hypothetical protein